MCLIFQQMHQFIEGHQYYFDLSLNYESFKRLHMDEHVIIFDPTDCYLFNHYRYVRPRPMTGTSKAAANVVLLTPSCLASLQGVSAYHDLTIKFSLCLLLSQLLMALDARE